MPPTVLTGVVTSAGVMAKTVTMTVARTKVHPKLLKVRVPALLLTSRTCATKSTLCTTPRMR